MSSIKTLFFLVIFFLLCLTACGSNKTQEAVTPTSSVTQPTITQVSVPTKTADVQATDLVPSPTKEQDDGIPPYPAPDQNATENPYPGPMPPYPAPDDESTVNPYPSPDDGDIGDPYPPPEQGTDTGAYPPPQSQPPVATPGPTATPIPTPTPIPTAIPLNARMKATDPDLVKLATGRYQFIEFFAFWDGYSKAMATIVHELEARYGEEITFVYLDVDDPRTKSLKEALEFELQPQFYLIDGNGKVLKVWQDLVDLEDFETVIRAVLY